MEKILYIEPIHKSGMEKLAETYEVIVAPDTRRETLEELIVDASAIVSRLTPIDRSLMEKGQKLKAICKHGVGVDNFDVKAAAELGIHVLTTGDANSLSVAEHAFFAIGALMKMITPLDREMRQSNWRFRDQARAYEVTGRTIGVVGFGKIGSRLTKMAVGGFDMEVLVYDPYVNAETIAASGAVKVESLAELCQRADVVSLHLPLNAETKGLITEELLRSMKPQALLINFARGGIVDEDLLCRALTEKWIAGAAVDAFVKEPIAADHPLLKLDNCLLSPHCASFTEESRRRMSLVLAEGIADVIEGREPKFSVVKLAKGE